MDQPGYKMNANIQISYARWRNWANPINTTALVGIAALLFSLLYSCPAQASSKPWQTLDGCVVVQNRSNDGDSFHVRWEGKEFIFRIYFADCPEDENRFPDRVKAQAEYFGITPEQAIAVGKQATEFTLRHLKKPFSVKTRWQYAMGSSHLQRNYGFVVIGRRDLAESLVRNGLARIHGVGVWGLTREEVVRLKALEAKAKAEGRGAWGMKAG